MSPSTSIPASPSLLIQAELSLPHILNIIRRQTRTLRNRLNSILADATFVDIVSSTYQLPILTNSRAGDWYVDPRQSSGKVYFKSTDGHHGQWKFSHRRLNLDVLRVAGRDDARGVIIVDSTRRGKSFPDALSKTIPIWIAVLNHILFPPADPDTPPTLHTPRNVVSASEHSQISALLPGFVADFLSLGLDLSEFRKGIKHPMLPIFIHPDSLLPEHTPVFDDITAIVLVSSSRMTRGEGMEGEYIQGAGDDHENWVAESGLDAELFWRYHTEIAACEEEELPELIRSLREREMGMGGKRGKGGKASLVKPTQNVFIAAEKDVGDGFEVIVNCGSQLLHLEKAVDGKAQPKILELGLPAGKVAVKKIRSELEGKLHSIRDDLGENRSVVFVCETGDNAAPVVALASLCLFYDEKGEFRAKQDTHIDKDYIRRRLAWISASRQSANPPRTLLNALNSVLMKF